MSIKNACVLIECPITGKVLGVSRKDDLTLFGLPGGKIEEDECSWNAAQRELLEETGIHCIYEDLNYIYDDGYSMTYQLRIQNIISVTDTKETGLVDWVTWEQLFDGPFGDYNRELYKAVKSKKA